jgi:predicted alpha/beta hydrolase
VIKRVVCSRYEAFARGDLDAALQMMEFSVAEHSVFHRGQAIGGWQEAATNDFIQKTS